MFTISSILELNELNSDELVLVELLLDELDSDELVLEKLLSDNELDSDELLSDELDSDELLSDALDSDELVSDKVDLSGLLVKAVRCFTLSAFSWSLSILIIYMLNLITLTEKICKVPDSSHFKLQSA